jgi:RND superfamily putative drug exporter
VVLPVKAIVMNVLSLTATFGAIVWIFQEGHLSGLLHFTPTGTIDPTMPILMLAIIFGLSMDYEVFLLSRIRERYDVTGDNTAAVAGGLQRTGGIITSLALLLVIVVGVLRLRDHVHQADGRRHDHRPGGGRDDHPGAAGAATMRLLGPANWWAPRPLRRFYALRSGGAWPPGSPRWPPARWPSRCGRAGRGFPVPGGPPAARHREFRCGRGARGGRWPGDMDRAGRKRSEPPPGRR